MVNNAEPTLGQLPATAGLDLSDTKIVIVELSVDGEESSSSTIPCTSRAVQRGASHYDGQRVVLKVGAHSPWISRLLNQRGFEVVVANPRRVKLISQNDSKTDLVGAGGAPGASPNTCQGSPLSVSNSKYQKSLERDRG